MRFSSNSPLLSLFVVLVSSALPSVSQTRTTTKEQPPASLASEPFVIMNEVVTEQWPATLALVNAPTDMNLLNPGQCIRAAAIASGAGHAHYFDQAAMSWVVRVAGKEDSFPLVPLTLTKQIKPEGSDFAMDVLRAGGVKENPIPEMVNATMAASESKWCVPQGTGDQTIEVSVTVKRGEQQTVLKTRKVQIESLASAAKKSFKDDREFSEFLQTYHVSPEPGRLLPGFQYLVASSQNSMIPFAFFRAAFKHDEATVQSFGPGLASSSKLTEILALNLMAKAGVALADPPALTGDEKKSIAEAADIPDAYDMQPTSGLAEKLDYLWADFSATGRPRPLNSVVSALAWQPDFAAFDKMRKSGKKPVTLTDSIMRGVCYMAAGWSLNSFRQTDPLAADFIDAISADSSTPAKIKEELAHMGTNPAFKRN